MMLRLIRAEIFKMARLPLTRNTLIVALLGLVILILYVYLTQDAMKMVGVASDSFAAQFFSVFFYYNKYVFGIYLMSAMASMVGSEFDWKTIHHSWLSGLKTEQILLSRWLVFVMYAVVAYTIFLVLAVAVYVFYSGGSMVLLDPARLLNLYLYLITYVSVAILVAVFVGRAVRAVQYSIIYVLLLESIIVPAVEQMANLLDWYWVSRLLDWTPLSVAERIQAIDAWRSDWLTYFIALVAWNLVFLLSARYLLNRREIALTNAAT